MKKLIKIISIIPIGIIFWNTLVYSDNIQFPSWIDFLKNKTITWKSFQILSIINDEKNNKAYFDKEVGKKYCWLESQYKDMKEIWNIVAWNEVKALIEMIDLNMNVYLRKWDSKKISENLYSIAWDFSKSIFWEKRIWKKTDFMLEEIKNWISWNTLNFEWNFYELDKPQGILNAFIHIVMKIWWDTSDSDDLKLKIIDILFLFWWKEIESLGKAFSTWKVAINWIANCSSEKDKENSKTENDIYNTYKSDIYLQSYYARKYLLKYRYNQDNQIWTIIIDPKITFIKSIKECYNDIKSIWSTDYPILWMNSKWLSIDWYKFTYNEIFDKQKNQDEKSNYIKTNSVLICNTDRDIDYNMSDKDLGSLAEKSISWYLWRIVSKNYNVYTAYNQTNVTEYITPYLLLWLNWTILEANIDQKLKEINISKTQNIEEKNNSLMDSLSLFFKKIFTSIKNKLFWESKPENVEKWLWKYETPNWKTFNLYQSWSAYYTKNIKFKIENRFISLSALKKYLDSNNPLVIDKYTTPNGKEFQITNYKGIFWIIYSDWKKGTGTFATKEWLIEFLKVNNGVCHAKVEKYIEPGSLVWFRLEKWEEEKFDWKMRIVTFDVNMNCGNWNLKISQEEWALYSNFTSWNWFKYEFWDIFWMAIWFEWPENEETPKTIKEEVVNTKDWEKWDIMVYQYKNWEYNIYSWIGLVKFSYNWKLNKEQLDNVINDLKYIVSTLQITSKNPYFNWYKLNNATPYTFWDPDSDSIRFTDSKWIVRIVKAKEKMYFDSCNPPDVNVWLNCSFSKYDSKTNSVIIEENVERNWWLPSEHTTYSINVDSWKVKKLSFKCIDWEIEKCSK